MIVEYNGATTEGFVDSIGYQFLYFVPKDSVDMDSMALKDIYYAYNDFNRVFHYSWSFEENVRRMETVQGRYSRFRETHWSSLIFNSIRI